MEKVIEQKVIRDEHVLNLVIYYEIHVKTDYVPKKEKVDYKLRYNKMIVDFYVVICKEVEIVVDDVYKEIDIKGL